MVYKPDYAKGKICVQFKHDYTIDFMTDFGNTLGCDLVIESVSGNVDNNFIYNVTEGKELEYVKKFRKYDDFIKEVDFFDLKSHRRGKELDFLINSINDLERVIYNKSLESFLSEVKEFEEKKQNYSE
jgi:hypothetical protein